MFQMTFSYRFEAAHRFTKSCSHSCATPHGHTWFAELHVVAVDNKLAADDMLVEFSLAKKNWKIFIDQVADHSWLGNIDDPILPHLRACIPHLRLLPFPGDPTTELIAILFYSKAEQFLKEAGLEDRIKVSSIVIKETPTNSVTWDSTKPGVSSDDGSYNGFRGWWLSPDPHDRSINK